jgi:hypothetical protein
MSDVIELLARGIAIGIGGAALMDAWALVARIAFNVQGLDYALLGRWIGHFPHGRFVHQRIGAAEPIRGERILGWAAHYAIGITFAMPLLAVWGSTGRGRHRRGRPYSSGWSHAGSPPLAKVTGSSARAYTWPAHASVPTANRVALA